MGFSDPLEAVPVVWVMTGGVGLGVFNVFFETSSRTRTTFEIAAKRLSADVINLDVTRSSTATTRSARSWR